MRAMVQLALVAFLFLACVSEASETSPVGYPYVTVYAKPVTDSVFSESSIQTNVAQWFSFRYAALSSLTASGVTLYDQAYNTTGDGYNMLSISLNSATYNNGFVYTYLNLMLPSLRLNGVMGSNVSVANATLVENPSPSVEIGFDSFPTQYNGSWSSSINVNLDFSPVVGTYVTIGINATGVEVSPWPLVIAFPAVKTSFQIRSVKPGTYTFIRTLINTTDDYNRYDFNVYQPTWVNSYLENLTITPPSASVLNYDSQPSDSFTVMIPTTYLYPNPRVVVGIRATPAGLTLSSTSLAMTTRGVPYTFYCFGPVGTFTILLTIAAPSNIQNQNNNFFYSPTKNYTVTFLTTLNVSTASIPDAYMPTPPASSVYGGAYSDPVPLHIQRPPKKGLTVSIDVENGEATPSMLTFVPGGTTTLLYQLRALTTGIKSVRYTLSGLSVGDYSTPSVRHWRVFGPNPHCLSRHDQKSCLTMNGCRWNAMKTLCSNQTIPILIGRIPLLFDGERSKTLNLTLPTPVANGLKITFIAASRLTFSPASVNLVAGNSEVNFTVLPALHSNEDYVSQSYYLQLSGADANVYSQQKAAIQIRSKVSCTCTYPWSFYVGTQSTYFTISCDLDPETDVTFRPVAVGQTGIAFVLVPPLNAQNNSLLMVPGQTTASFYAVSSSTPRTGNFTISFVLGGTNAARYDTVPTVPIRILALGQLNIPPHFWITEKTLSDTYHVDISIPPSDIVYVNMTIYNTSSGLPVPNTIATVTPSFLTFNASQRASITMYCTTPGTYVIDFNITSTIANYFNPPANATFTVLPVRDGSAFTPRLTLGFMPTRRCRVNVGRNSEFFKGQNQVDSLSTFCDAFSPVSAGTSYDCASIATEIDCRAALKATGNLCVWNVSSCILLQDLQGFVTDIAYGSGFVLMLTRNRTVFSIGVDKYNQLGHHKNYAAQVPINDNITAIVAGTAHSLALSALGYVYAWGNNNQGQLGIGSNTQVVLTPTKITFPKGENITCISAGALHSAAVSLSGIAYVWGSNLFGQLANVGTFRTIARTPVAVGRDKFDGDSAIAIQCGEYHTMVATASNAYSFGLNAQGQLGRPGFDEYKPAKPILWSTSRFVSQPQYASFITGENQCGAN